MSRAPATLLPETGMPTPFSQAWLGFRVFALRGQRALRNVTHPVPKLRTERAAPFPDLLARVETPLYASQAPEERAMELGKIQNLRVAARALDGLALPADGVFSFWRQLGRCTRAKGYVPGRQLQEGCLVRAVGGGICGLSNALYELALKIGAEIVERHPHTRIVPGSAAERNLDATVAWNHIDLRFRVTAPVRLHVRLTNDRLIVEAFGQVPSVATPPQREAKSTLQLRQAIDPGAHSCGSCERTDCHLFSRGKGVREGARTAFLVEERWPEFDAYLLDERQPDDLLMAPLPKYGWTAEGWVRVEYASLATYRRSLRLRRVAHQGAARQQARLRSFEELARAYARRLTPETTHLVVSLELLPFLWREGHLGGRTFDVLMTRFPMAELQRRLDAAHRAHSERALLADFRAPAGLVRAETDALAAARRLVTPHRAVAANDPRRWLLDWAMPSPGATKGGDSIAFPGPTVARKGAYEVREAMWRLERPLVRLGRDLEGEGFWDGLDVRRPEGRWLEGVGVVVQPAILEDRPRRLLEAIAAGIPVICTDACGVAGYPGVTLVREGDADALVRAITAIG